jgi:peroxiredoxin
MALLAPAAVAELKPGEKVPEVTLKDLNGKAVKLSQLRGSAPVLVNFFATW